MENFPLIIFVEIMSSLTTCFFFSKREKVFTEDFILINIMRQENYRSTNFLIEIPYQ